MPKKTENKESEVAPMLLIVHGVTYLHESTRGDKDEKPDFLGENSRGVQYYKILTVKKIRSKKDHSVLNFGKELSQAHQDLSKFTGEEFKELLPVNQKLRTKMKDCRKEKTLLPYEDLKELMKIQTANLMGKGEYSFLGTVWNLHKVFSQRMTRISTKELRRGESND